MTTMAQPSTTQRFTIIDSYPMWRGIQLHSLSEPSTYDCDACGRRQDSAMVAFSVADTVICPACYSFLLG